MDAERSCAAIGIRKEPTEIITRIDFLASLWVTQAAVRRSAFGEYLPTQYTVTPYVAQCSVFAWNDNEIVWRKRWENVNDRARDDSNSPKLRASGAVHLIGICFIPSETIYSSSSLDMPKSEIFTMLTSSSSNGPNSTRLAYRLSIYHHYDFMATFRIRLNGKRLNVFYTRHVPKVRFPRS